MTRAHRSRGTGVPRPGFTLTEAIIGFVLATVLIGLIYAVFIPSHRQGVAMERRLQTTHSILVLHGMLETDVQAAEDVGMDGGTLVLKRFLSRDPNTDDYGVLELVRYSHQPGERVARHVQIKPRPGGGQPPPVQRGSAGLQPFSRVRFSIRESGRLVDVSAEVLEPTQGISEGALMFTLQSPLSGLPDRWMPNGFW